MSEAAALQCTVRLVFLLYAMLKHYHAAEQYYYCKDHLYISGNTTRQFIR